MSSEEFSLGDEPIEVERRPGGSGMVIRIDLDPTEAFSVLARAEFEGLTLSQYCERTILEHAAQHAWVRLTP